MRLRKPAGNQCAVLTRSGHRIISYNVCYTKLLRIHLDLIGSGLNGVIKKLHDTYRFNTLYVTAHSMGGLVSRSFIMKNVYEDGEDYIKLFVSISTPWDGHRAAEKGVENAPSVIP